jgi:DNA methylase
MSERRWRTRIVGHGEVDPRTLVLDPRNPKVHPPEQDRVVDASLTSLGWVKSVQVNTATGQVVDGHERVELALRYGEKAVPVEYVELTQAEAAEALLTLDQSAQLAMAHMGRWAALRAEVETQEPALLEFWGQFAASQGVESYAPPVAGPRDVEEAEVPPDQVDEAVGRLQVAVGDLWACGRHRVMCGDSREAGALVGLLGGAVPTVVLADPPYGIDIVQADGFVGGGEAYHIPFGGVKTSRGQRRAVGRLPVVAKYAPVAGDSSVATAVQVSGALLRAYPQAVQVWWGGNYYADQLPASSCWLVWNKETNGHFADCELAWTNQAKAAKLFTHRWNGMLRASEHGRRWHPTQKPVALMVWVLDTFGGADEVVLDPFLGSGPVLLAGEQCGHTVYGLDMTPECCAMALERWAKLTGQTPERVG